MVQLTTIFTAALLTALGYSAPTSGERIKDIVTDVYGPLENWTPVYLIDVYPNALVDGAPANSSVILRYEPPATATDAQRELVSTRLSARTANLQARDGSETCYYTGTYVFQNQLQVAKNAFCNDVQVRGISNGANYWENLSGWYDANSNSFVPFTTAQGTTDSVFYYLQVNGGYEFNWNVCYNAFFTIISDCHGSNPDSAGGHISGYNNGQVDATVDPWD